MWQTANTLPVVPLFGAPIIVAAEQFLMVLICPADPFHAGVLSAHRQAKVSRMHHSRTRPLRLATKLRSSVARWLERERQTDTFPRYGPSICSQARGATARQIADEVPVLRRLMATCTLFCVMFVIGISVSL